jgi:tRNA-2-methylthio-N6-dimethylallyladenosine synthase
MKRAYVETYGCQMNKLDSELAEQALSEAGFVRSEDPADADLVVLNTCSVREHAEHRVVSRLGRLKPGSPLRKAGSVLALVGCMGSARARSCSRSRRTWTSSRARRSSCAFPSSTSRRRRAGSASRPST